MPKVGQPIRREPIAKSVSQVPIANTKPRKERLALNLFDLTDVIHPSLRPSVAPQLDLSSAIWVDKTKQEETAVAFTCDLITAAMTCDVLRDQCRKNGDRIARVYICRAEVWTRLPERAVLTVVRDGQVQLNPEWFPVEREPEAIQPLPIKRICFA